MDINQAQNKMPKSTTSSIAFLLEVFVFDDAQTEYD